LAECMSCTVITAHIKSSRSSPAVVRYRLSTTKSPRAPLLASCISQLRLSTDSIASNRYITKASTAQKTSLRIFRHLSSGKQRVHCDVRINGCCAVACYHSCYMRNALHVVCNVSFIVCVALCAVFCLSVMCYFV
jgi:hypothetical protein